MATTWRFRKRATLLSGLFVLMVEASRLKGHYLWLGGRVPWRQGGGLDASDIWRHAQSGARGHGRASDLALCCGRSGARPRHPWLVGRSCLSWLTVEDTPDQEPAADARVMPVFPLNVVELPGGVVRLNIIEPAYRKMYDDILVSGTRRFLMPFSPCVAGFPRGRVRFPEMDPADRRLHAIAPILFLEDLSEVSEQTDGFVKYQVKHSVLGYARMTRLLNPSALFRTNSEGWKVEYLRAEVDLLENTPDSALDAEAAEALYAAWEGLRQISERISEPRLQGEEVVREAVRETPTWEIAGLWQSLQFALQAHRDQVRVVTSIQQWMESSGTWPAGASVQDIDFSSIELPDRFSEALEHLRSPHSLPLDDDFWEPLLRIQAAGGAAKRGELLLEAAREELRLARARESLRTM